MVKGIQLGKGGSLLGYLTKESQAEQHCQGLLLDGKAQTQKKMPWKFEEEGSTKGPISSHPSHLHPTRGKLLVKAPTNNVIMGTTSVCKASLSGEGLMMDLVVNHRILKRRLGNILREREEAVDQESNCSHQIVEMMKEIAPFKGRTNQLAEDVPVEELIEQEKK
ncbi:hypothetical protein NE237_020718 [Protea cynaroides]|uniref:Uncharacterized protein n=1 Tax=Protea cynaroides TaxID=273540 RepID=A0A9Q0H767_9MAGN|nr:hypothetical protein NE237_020718 [Protea cynaroides]